MHEDGEPDTRKLEKVEGGLQMPEESGEGDRRCALGFGLGKWARKEDDDRRHDDGQRHSGETLIMDAGFACFEHAGSRMLRGRQGLGTQSTMTDLGLSARVRVSADSTTAKGIASRRGLGKTIHIEFEMFMAEELEGK